MKHPSLPNSITPDALGQWLTENAKERFCEEIKHYYSEEELQELKDLAVRAGIEINKLTILKKNIIRLAEKGSLTNKIIDFPQTIGVKLLKEKRERCEQEVERGYKVEEMEIFGIPNPDGTMDFFDIRGNEIKERCRPLNEKEAREYFGLFANLQKLAKV